MCGQEITRTVPLRYSYNLPKHSASTANPSYTYDPNGNTLTKTDSTGTTQYARDFENRLTSVTLAGSGGTIHLQVRPLRAANLQIVLQRHDHLRLRRRHVTPERVLHSNFAWRIGSIKKSGT